MPTDLNQLLNLMLTLLSVGGAGYAIAKGIAAIMNAHANIVNAQAQEKQAQASVEFAKAQALSISSDERRIVLNLAEKALTALSSPTTSLANSEKLDVANQQIKQVKEQLTELKDAQTTSASVEAHNTTP